MADLAVPILISCTLFSYLINRRLLNPTTLTLAIFSLASFLASLHLYGLYAFPDIAYRIVVVGCVALLAGSIFGKVFHAASLRNAKVVRRRRDLRWRISYRFLNIGLLVTIATILATRGSSLAILASGGNFADVRNSYLGYSGAEDYASSMDALFGRIIVSPFLFASLPVFVYGLIEGQRNRRFSWLFIVAMALNLITSGGRIILLYAVVELLVLLAINGRLRVRMSRGRAVTLAAALVLVVALVTLSRGNTILFEAYTYFAIPLPLLSHWASLADSQSTYTNGAGFLYGIVTLMSNALKFVGIDFAQSAADAVSRPQAQWVELVPGRPFNAFVTLFYYFYLDFRFVGVMLFSGIYGFFVQTAYDRARSFGGARPKLLLLLTIQSVVMAFVRWEATDGAYVLAFVLLFLSVRKSKEDGASEDAVRCESDQGLRSLNRTPAGRAAHN